MGWPGSACASRASWVATRPASRSAGRASPSPTQAVPEPAEILLHAQLRDPEPARQQGALGILGVNLVHGAFHSHAAPTELIGTLLDGLDTQRVEIDVVHF